MRRSALVCVMSLACGAIEPVKLRHLRYRRYPPWIRLRDLKSPGSTYLRRNTK